MPEKTVAALKADKAKTVLFGKRRAEVPEHVRPEAVMLHVLRSQSGTTVWTGRALQVRFDDLEVIGLALLYPALEWNVVFLAIMDIRARPISFSERP